MSSLADRFATHPLRETSGSQSSNRFEYQDNWALCKLVELHETGQEYLMFLEFHDDIVVMDCAVNPTVVEFFQVKTKSKGHWSIATITGQKKGKLGKLPSIIGKLYSNYEAFPDETIGLNLVSNAYANFKLQPAGNAIGYALVRFDDLADCDQVSIEKKLSAETGTPARLIGLKLFSHHTTDLSIGGSADQALGRLTRYLASKPSTSSIQAAPFYRTLKQEISRRAKCERKQSSYTFEEISSFKAIDRSNFSKMIHYAEHSTHRPDLVSLLRERLNAENIPYGKVVALCAQARAFQVDMFDTTNRQVGDASEIVKEVVGQADVFEIDRIIDAINELATCCQTRLVKQKIQLANEYVKGIVGVFLIEKQTISNTDPNA